MPFGASRWSRSSIQCEAQFSVVENPYIHVLDLFSIFGVAFLPISDTTKINNRGRTVSGAQECGRAPLSPPISTPVLHPLFLCKNVK